MISLPTFYIGDDEKKLEKQYRMMLKDIEHARKDIKHYYYGMPVEQAERKEDCNIETSCIIERACSGALPIIMDKLKELRGGIPLPEQERRETRVSKTYSSIKRIIYNENNAAGGSYTYVADFEGDDVIIYKMSECVELREHIDGYLYRDDKIRPDVTEPYREKLFFDLWKYLDASYYDHSIPDTEKYRAAVRKIMKELVPWKVYLPRECDIKAEERLGREGLTSKDMFIDALKRIGIDEWRKSYMYSGKESMWKTPDGILRKNCIPAWNFIVRYFDKDRFINEGSSDCPFNLHLLTRLLDGLDDSEFFDYNRDYFLLDDGK